MNSPDEDNERDWPLIAVTIIVGMGLVVFAAYALSVVLHMRI